VPGSGTGRAPNTVEPPQVMVLDARLLRIVSAGLGFLRVGGSGGDEDTMPVSARGKLAVNVDGNAELERRNERLLGEDERL